MSGWFANYNSMKEYEEFFEERRILLREKGIRIDSHDVSNIFYMARLALFGIVGEVRSSKYTASPCYAICRNENGYCKQRGNSFCKAGKAEKRSNVEPNFYRIHKNMIARYRMKSISLIAIIGEHRYNAFIEFLHDKARERYNRYTRRERNEKNLVKIEEFDAGFVSLEAIQEDPWEKFRANKIQQGDLECLHLSDSLFSA